ncbi:hypothetical protein [Mucilaginibacter sp. PPCGB 2223]|uniref:hypothetical protein n=1 Tax=Mucilaginibacter sp. PPCGB 2223 TaxID=1886027 RepID=UPI0011125A43|nr:hypothetical protein [Mucilaginibacter sp. PPCGB 2223]
MFCQICSGQSAKDSITSPARTLSYKQYNAYLNGDDYDNMALVAELNDYPAPQRAIELKKQLGLSSDQVAKITAVDAGLIRKKKEMGRLIIKNERVLDSLFRIRQVDDGTLVFYGQRTDLFRGELRNAILQAYLKVYGILTPNQRIRYKQLHKL